MVTKLKEGNTNSIGIAYSYTTDDKRDWNRVPLKTYFYDKSTKQVWHKNENGQFFNIWDNSQSQIGKSYPAGETLGGQRLVKLVDGKAYYFDYSDDSNVGKLIGITNHAAIAGELVFIVMQGIIQDSTWGLTPNAVYYAGPSSVISTTITLPPFVFQRVGVAIDNTSLKLELSEPVSTI